MWKCLGANIPEHVPSTKKIGTISSKVRQNGPQPSEGDSPMKSKFKIGEHEKRVVVVLSINQFTLQEKNVN